MTEYVVLGALLVIMGGAQIWLRWGPWSRDLQQADEALAKRRAEALSDGGGEKKDADDDAVQEVKGQGALTSAGSRLWNKWTAILGPLGILLGLFLLFWGIFAG